MNATFDSERITALQKQVAELYPYKANWEALWTMLSDLEYIPDNGTKLETVDGFVQVWKKQNDRIKELEMQLKQASETIEEYEILANQEGEGFA